MTADAAELIWDGHYQVRGQTFQSLSLSDSNPNAEAGATLVDHRLRLQPGWLISDRVGVFVQLDVLPYVLWGDESTTFSDPVTGDDPAIYTHSVGPATTEDGDRLANIEATRVWGEVQTGIGSVRFGRMPLAWGTGMVLNAGNDPGDEFGDTADRIQLTARTGDVFLQGGIETNSEGYINEVDDIWTVTGAVIYKTEKAGTGIYNSYRRQSGDETKFGLYTVDIWGEAQAGVLEFSTEFAAQFGSGDLDEDTDEATISAFGFNLDAGVTLNQIRLGLLAGFAGGDKNPDDKKFHTFHYDPDFNVSLFMFEEPMPVLEPTVKNANNDGRNDDVVLTGYRISNAFFARPRVGYQVSEDFYADISFIIGQAAALPEDEAENKTYGSEIDLWLHYTPMDAFSLDGAFGVFLPGAYYSSFEDVDLGGGFDTPVWGGQILGTIHF